jgi:hypothetical protein
MSNFKIEFGTDWKILRKQLTTEHIIEKVLPDITDSILKLHNVMEQRVDSVFNAPTKLSSVLLGSSKRPEEIGKTFLRYQLQYRFKPIKLADYPYEVSGFIPVRNAIPFMTKIDTIGYTPVNKARVTTVSIARGKYVVPRRVKRSPMKGFELNGNIVARTKKATWSSIPTDRKDSRSGTRTPLQTIYGAPLDLLAQKVYERDPQVANAVSNLYEEIEVAIMRSFSSA